MNATASALGRKKPSPAKNMMKLLQSRGDDLGINPKIVREGEADTVVPNPVVSAKAMEDAKRFPTPIGDVAIAHAARDAGRSFVADHASYGLLLGRRDSTRANAAERFDAKIAMIKAAPDDQLQEVLRITATKYGQFKMKEDLLRAEQLVKNFPSEYAPRIMDTSKGKTREENMAALASEISKKDFQEIRPLTLKDGIPVSLPDEERVQMMSLQRGYQQLAKELRSRSIEPAYTMAGRPVVARATGITTERPAQSGKVVRGGVEL